jgi:hypothetical protein
MRNILFFIFFCFISIGSTKGQGAKMQALYIYNFTKQMEWPDSYVNKNLVIGVYGSKETFNEINGLLKGQKIGSRDIHIVFYNSLNDISDCHVLFIPDAKVEILQSIFTKLSKSPILIVTNLPGMIERGACINFTIVEGKQLYEISKKNIQSHNIAVSNELINLGINK